MSARRGGWLHPVCGLMMLAGTLSTARPAAADWNATPIALPLIGTEGAGSPYPSTITFAPTGGPATTGAVQVFLHNVTHPCPEDLVVLLVHDGAGYLLMSGAGGCRALQGTTIGFGSPALTLPLPDSETGSPHGASLLISPSVYGAPPTLPAPAPAGPYTIGLPPSSTPTAGAWDLYVVDRAAANRGVVAAGWSLHASTTVRRDAAGAPFAIPVSGETAPILFDMTAVDPAKRVRGVILSLILSHTFPDDLEIVLQSPAGTTVVVMADAGGGTDLASTALIFHDGAPAAVTDTGAITSGQYRPGGSYATIALANPPGPHATAFSAFDNQPLTGTWRLWVNDDVGVDSGSIAVARLDVVTEFAPLIFGIDTPTSSAATTSTSMFLRLAGEIEDLDGQWAGRWRSVVDGVYYDSGAMRFGTPPSDIVEADVPLKRGSNVITVTLKNVSGLEVTDTLTVNVPEFAYYLTEGATGGFFDTEIGIFNPTATAAPIAMSFLPESGAAVAHALTLGAPSAAVLTADDFVPPGGVSTVVRSTDGIPLAIERTMYWDATRYGGHGGTAVDGAATRWLFAEGAQGFFDTYVLLANDNASAVSATVRFLRETGGPVVITPSLPAHSRTTIWAGSVAGLEGASFGIEVTAPSPITAERAMYFPHGASRVFEGGTGTAGVTRGSTRWFLAEGATGPFFECFVLVSNPEPVAATVTFTYLLPSGATLTRTATLAANARLTVNVETVDPLLANTPVSIQVTSNRGIVVERAMYWPEFSAGWQEAHDSFGVTEPGLRWGLGNGMVGTPQGFETYVLLANPNPAPAEVEVVFIKAGAVTPPIVKSYTLAPTSRRNVAASVDVPELGSGAFGVEVRVLNYQPIAVEKAMYWNAGGVTWAGGSGVTASRLPPP